MEFITYFFRWVYQIYDAVFNNLGVTYGSTFVSLGSIILAGIVILIVSKFFWKGSE